MIRCECGYLNEDGMRYCEDCGALLVEDKTPKRPVHPPKTSDREVANFSDFICELIGKLFVLLVNAFSGNRERIDAMPYINKTKTFVPDRLKLCEGEKLIKQYYCAKEKLAIFGVNLHHFIQVTNKRIIYCRIGNSFFGPKEIQTAVPIDDIANISIERGYKINLLSLLFGGLQFYPYLLIMIPAVLLGAFLFFVDGMGIITTIASIILFVLSFKKYEVVIGKKRYSLNDTLYYASVGLIAVTTFGKVLNSGFVVVTNMFTTFRIDAEVYKIIKFFLSIVGFVIPIRGWIDFLRCIVKKYYNVEVGAKSGQSSPISSGGTEALAVTADMFEKFVPVVPVGDAREMESELNAMILDIQQLGDYGIEKWKDDEYVL